MYDYPGPLGSKTSSRKGAHKNDKVDEEYAYSKSKWWCRISSALVYRSGEESQTHVESVKASKKEKPG